MKKYHVHRKYVVEVEEIEEDGVVLRSIHGTFYPQKGDYLATDIYKNKYIITKDRFEEEYEKVDIGEFNN